MAEAGIRSNSDRWERLLAGGLSAEEEASLLDQIEHDETARCLLEEVAADAAFRSDVQRYLSCRLPLDPIAQRIINSLSPSLPEPEPPSLDFLEPADSGEYLGQFDGYRVIECVGSGGMGIVLKAFDPALDRLVALKVLSPLHASSSRARRRFLQEARAAAAIRHEHIITIHAVGESAGLPYLVMELVQGPSLQERIDSCGPLELADILRIGRQVASGLAAAHAQGLIHRDVKPGNILLENGGERVKITDFGLARTADEHSMTRSGMTVGTPEYMAPEQAEGKPIDARADLFSLGSVLYAMCTGESPFRSTSLAGTIRRLCDGTPVPVQQLNPKIPGRLVELISRLQAKCPDDRYQTAEEVVDALADIEQGLIAGRRLTRNASPPGKNKPASFGWLLSACGILLVAAALLSAMWWGPRPTDRLSESTANRSSRSSVTSPVQPTSPNGAGDTVTADLPAAFGKNITLLPPYKPPYPGAPTDRLSVQYAVIAICRQIGVAYQWDRSQANTAPLNRRWIRPRFKNVPAKEALTRMLSPLGLTFAIDEAGLYLQRASKRSKRSSVQ